MEKVNFFGNKDVQNTIFGIVDVLVKKDEANKNFRTDDPLSYHVLKILEEISMSNGFWDNHCQVTIEMFKSPFVKETEGFLRANNERQEQYASLLYAFAIEFNLSVSEKLSREVQEYITFIEGNLIYIANEIAVKWINHYKTSIPIMVIKRVLNSPDIKTFRKAYDFSQNYKTIIDEWEENLNSREQRVNALKDNLDKYEAAYNFVGLYDGYKMLRETKKTELSRVSFFLVILGFLAMCPLLGEISVLFLKPTLITKYKDLLIYLVIPSLSLIIILLYYFRIMLQNYKSIKNQLLQIDLRMTLLQFIQNYAKESKTLFDEKRNTMNKFENMIFAPIVSDKEKTPSTFDGLEPLVNLVKELKK